MGREHTQNPGDQDGKRMGGNPGTFSPDDDEAQEADRSSIDDQPDSLAQDGQQSPGQTGQRRQAQAGAEQPEENIEQVEDDDSDEGDDDEVTSISQ